MDEYDAKAIEQKWQAVWEAEQAFHADDPEPGDERPRFYQLEMLPYPSGEPHVGHLKNYTIGDAVAHFKRRTGHRVLHPMGYDAFGLPAEQHAIQTGTHPRTTTQNNINNFRRQIKATPEIEETDEYLQGGKHRPPRLYRFTGRPGLDPDNRSTP